MPAKRFTASTSKLPVERKAASSTGQLSKKVEPCIVCGMVLSRAFDLPRHMIRHDTSAKKFPCPWIGCEFSTRQKSNLDIHYRGKHTQDKRHICTDDPGRCKFETSHPASLLRHRKHQHNYKTRSHTKSSTAVTTLTVTASSSSGGTPFSVESSSKSFSPASPLPSLLSTSLSSPSYLFPLQVGESETTFFSLDSVLPPADSSHSPPHKNPRDFFNSSPPCSYNYACDTSFWSGFDFLAAEPNMEQFDIPRNDPWPGSIYPMPSDSDLLGLFFDPPLELAVGDGLMTRPVASHERPSSPMSLMTHWDSDNSKSMQCPRADCRICKFYCLATFNAAYTQRTQPYQAPFASISADLRAESADAYY